MYGIILIAVTILSCVLIIVLTTRLPTDHTNKTRSPKPKYCSVCEGKLKRNGKCKICEKAQIIVNLEDLEQHHKREMETDEDRLIRAINFYQTQNTNTNTTTSSSNNNISQVNNVEEQIAEIESYRKLLPHDNEDCYCTQCIKSFRILLALKRIDNMERVIQHDNVIHDNEIIKLGSWGP